MTLHVQTVLRALLGQGIDGGRRAGVLSDGLYGLELSRVTELPNGTLFPILERLRQAGWVERYWEADGVAEAEGRPRRRFYRITTKGAEPARHALAEATASNSGDRAAGKVRPGFAGGSF
ncbi:PadR family transcriptional regulator [Streptomyces sp. NBC_00370]